MLFKEQQKSSIILSSISRDNETMIYDNNYDGNMKNFMLIPSRKEESKFFYFMNESKLNEFDGGLEA